MVAKNITRESQDNRNIEDDMSDETVDKDKLAALKAKLESKKAEAMASKVVERPTRSLNLGVLGSGQAGARLAEAFYKLGYEAVVVNTATQDLKFIDLPEDNKFLLDFGVGGAGKELTIGQAAAEAHRDDVAKLVEKKLFKSQVNVLALSLGGGSGAGSCEVMVDVLAETGKPLVVMTVLPMNSEDVQTKNNALETLAKLSKMVQSKRIQNLIVVDNAKIESILSDVGSFEFFKVANEAIVRPIDVLNTLSSMPSDIKGLDPMEASKLLIDGDGLTVYGEITVDDFSSETSLAEAVINNLNSNLLSGGFDIKQSKYVGVIFTAPKRVWDQIPSLYVNYAMSMVNEQCGQPKGVFKGIYAVESDVDAVNIYSYFTGLGLPDARVTQLKSEVKTQTEAVKAKDVQRNLNLTLDTGVHETVSEAQKIKDKIAAKNSAFGKFLVNTVDRRKG